MIRTRSVHALALLAASFCAPCLLHAQPAATKPDASLAAKPAQELSKACPDCTARRHDDGTWPTRTFYLKYATSQNEINEIATALRTLLAPPDMTFVVASKSAIVVHAFPDDITLAQKVLDDLDRPEKSWRLTYTISEMDGTNRVGAQHYSMIVASGQQTVLKQGDRVPIVTGRSTQTNDHLTQVSYQDIGMNFSANLDELGEGARLRSDVEQTRLADDKSSTADPVFRQTGLKSEATLLPGKPLVLGAMDIPDSTHHLQIEVLMERLP